MNLFTIGFTQRTAESFFEDIIKSGTTQIIDVRLNNISQLAGFSKRDDLKYFLKKIGSIEYIHMPILAPTKVIFDDYKKKLSDWKTYENRFIDLMEFRKIENEISINDLMDGCLLCSEFKAHYCHRRLVAEYLNRKWDVKINIIHL